MGEGTEKDKDVPNGMVVAGVSRAQKKYSYLL